MSFSKIHTIENVNNTSEAEESEEVLGLGLASGEIGDLRGWRGQRRVGRLHRSAAGRVGLRLSKLPLGLQSGSDTHEESHLIRVYSEQSASRKTTYQAPMIPDL